MNIRVDRSEATPMRLTFRLRCPACRHRAALEFFPEAHDIVVNETIVIAHRKCPNPDCHAYILVASEDGIVIASYPPEVIDFDATDVPAPIVSAVQEAITCHAHDCFVAAAIMVRKTLEELCKERGATGDNLKDRVRALSTRVVLPRELLDGLDDLRLLGNDAAHLESQTYDQIGKQEVEIAIDFTKEVLKAVYQYATLLSRLKSLKKSP